MVKVAGTRRTYRLYGLKKQLEFKGSLLKSVASLATDLVGSFLFLLPLCCTSELSGDLTRFFPGSNVDVACALLFSFPFEKALAKAPGLFAAVGAPPGFKLPGLAAAALGGLGTVPRPFALVIVKTQLSFPQQRGSWWHRQIANQWKRLSECTWNTICNGV